ncbi:MAG: MFS transporter [Candidatus Humimicrobiaceae bacterium]
MQKKKNLKLFYLSFFTLGFIIPIFDPLYPYFAQTFNIGFDKIGLLFFAGSLTAIITMVTAGRLSDKISSRKMFLWSFVISFAGFAVFSIFHNFIGLIVTVLIVNVGLNLFWPAAYAKIFHDYRDNYSTMLVKLERFYCLATVLGPLLISLLLYLRLSPRFVFILLLLMFIFIFFKFYRGYQTGISDNVNHIDAGMQESEEVIITDQQKRPEGGKKSEPKREKLFKKIHRFFTPTVIFVNLALALFAGVNMGTSAWLTTYFTSFDIPVSFSSIFVAIYWFSAFIGLQILTKIMHKLKEEKILFFGGIISLVSLIGFSFVNQIYLKIMFIMFVGIAVSGIYPLCGSITIRENPKSAGTSSGFSIAMGLVGGLIVSPVMGFVAQYLSTSYVPYVLIILSLLGTIMSAILLRIIFKKELKAS